jgi:type IV pilus assembly protein PilN
MRVVGPHDRSVELVRNLEHSRRFLEPRIVGENSESTNNPNQRMEPVSASNRFDFDLLAEYNPPSRDETRPTPNSKKASEPDGGDSELRSGHPRLGSDFTRHAGRPPYTGSAPKPNPTPGGPQ